MAKPRKKVIPRRVCIKPDFKIDYMRYGYAGMKERHKLTLQILKFAANRPAQKEFWQENKKQIMANWKDKIKPYGFYLYEVPMEDVPDAAYAKYDVLKNRKFIQSMGAD